MIKRILVGLAGTSYTPVAIQRAVSLAEMHDAEVTGVTVLDPRRVRSRSFDSSQSEAAGTVRESRLAVTEACLAQSIRDLRTACEMANIKHRVCEETGDAFTRLADLSRYHDLMIFGLRSVFEYDFAAGDPEALLVRLVSAGVRPLIAVPKEFRTISRVMIAYNGSVDSAKAMKRFVQMRLWPHAELKIMTFHPSNDEAQKLMLAAEEYCQSHGFPVCHQSNPGEPSLLLLGAATLWQADMIVMGNSGRNVLMRKILGDTLLGTLRDTRIPLFLAQ